MGWIVVAAGGALGSVARHAVNLGFARAYGRPVPYGTAAVNLVGCLAIGVLAGLIAADRIALTPDQRSFVFVGILGGFTTFSSFGLDTFTLAHGGDYTAACWNVAAQVALGLLAVYAGFRVAHV